ncbi:MAG: carbon storage regulator [Rubripirellula sp.]
MLVLSRKEGESIEFRDLNVCVRVIQLKKSKVQLGIEAPRTIQVDRTETLACHDENERSGGQQNPPRLSRKFDQKRLQTNQSESEERLLDELAKLEVEVMTLAELVTAKNQDLARQTALVSLERLNGVRKMLQVSSTTRSTPRSISDFIKARHDQIHGAGSGDRPADFIAHQDGQEIASTPTSQSQIDCLRQSGVGYFVESEVVGFSEQKAL